MIDDEKFEDCKVTADVAYWATIIIAATVGNLLFFLWQRVQHLEAAIEALQQAAL